VDPERFQNSTAGKPIRTSGGYWAFVPNPLPPELAWSDGMVSKLSEAERSLAALGEKGSDFADPLTMVQPFIRREAVLSSRIEGTRADLDDLYRYETYPDPDRAGAGDELEVANYVRALLYGIERLNSLPMSLRLIREIHARLFEGLSGQHATPGEFRRSQNWIGPPGSTLENAPYVPPPVEHMQAGLDQLEKYIHAPSDLPGLIRIGLIHYQFEAIHPFIDGNGRIGRLLIALLLRDWGLLPHPWLYLSGYFDAHRQAYYAGLLGVSESGDWEGWLSLFLEAVARQSEEAGACLNRLEQLHAHYQLLVAKERASDGLTKTLDLLFGQPMATVRQVEAGIGASDYKTAQRYVQRLVELGILREITGGRRNRIYRADGIFDAIQGTLEL
jgi:Fic family protein